MEYSYTFYISSKKNAITNHQILAGKSDLQKQPKTWFTHKEQPRF